ncbi:MAG: NAD(P)H-dependent oxidoreductase [Gemmatimonadaceae bacterium]|nr:NAD(P)H-dependent oxidoreductase [Gemmatimonadaceae bacterium]
MEPHRILAVSGSLRRQSSSTEVLRALAMVGRPSLDVVLYDGVATLPHFNPDDDGESAAPAASVARLRQLVDAADALVICSPEYAHGVPGSLKNALDWLVSGSEIPAKPVGLLNASARSTHAVAALAETLRTMSVRLVDGATGVIPLDGRGLDAAGIAADPALRDLLCQVAQALGVAAAAHARDRQPSRTPLAWSLRA